MAILIPGEFWPVPLGTELNCNSCGAPAKYLCEIADAPSTEWMLRCEAHRTGTKWNPIPFEDLYWGPAGKS
jgi:hypothetical protein